MIRKRKVAFLRMMTWVCLRTVRKARREYERIANRFKQSRKMLMGITNLVVRRCLLQDGGLAIPPLPPNVVYGLY